MDNVPWISLMVFAPLLSAIAAAVAPHPRMSRTLAMGGAVFSLAVSLVLWARFDGSTSALQFVEVYGWIPQFGVRYIVGLDGLNLLLVVLTTFLTPLVLLSQWHLKDPRQKGFVALIMTLETGMLGALVAFDMIFFYVFWEAMLIPMYFLIGIWGGDRRIYATTKFVIYTVIGSLLMLVAAIALYMEHFHQFGVYSTSLLDLYRVRTFGDAQHWLFAAFALAFAIKVPIWPFHTWLPDAHVEAPTAGSVILAGVLLKMGTYGLIRFAIPLFPEATQQFGPLIVILGIIGIIYGALTAWAQRDAKKLVAYSSISHLGFVVIGSVASVGDGLSPEALLGATYQMINHGISTGALFFLVGFLYERRHTRKLSDFGGLASVMPRFAILLIVATLGSIGLPGTGGFVGEFLVLLGTFRSSPFAALVASIGVLLGAVYMLALCRQVLFGPLRHEENRLLRDLSPRELAVVGPLAVLIVVMGVVPELFVGKMRASVNHLASDFRRYQLVLTRDAQGSTLAASERKEVSVGE